MRRSILTLALLGLTVSTALGDGLILNDGRRLSGRVVEKPDGYEITIENQTVGLTKAEVKQWVKSPKEVLGDADRLIDEAKKLYSEAVTMSDEKAAETKFRDALPRVQKAREAYVEARELFPDNYPELDEKLVNTMKLMRLVRERFHSQLASSDAPVKLKDAPPKPVKPAPAPVAKPAMPTPPAPTPDAPVPVPAPVPAAARSMQDALLVMVDPAKRADESARASARGIFMSASAGAGALADVAMAGWMFLSRPDEDWGLLSDIVVVKGASGETSYKGRLEKRSEAITILILSDKREFRIRSAAEGKYVTPPGSTEFKAADLKILPDQKNEAFEALQAFFKGIDAAKFESLEDKEISEGVKFLAMKVKDLRSKNQPTEALSLFVAGPASALIAKNVGKSSPDLDAAFKDLGYEKSEFGAVWGRKEGLAMDDYRKWLSSGEYGMAIVQFQNDYRSVSEPNVRYAMGLLMLFRALAENRNYQKAAAYLDGASREAASPGVRDHFAALAKSIRDDAPCNVCSGTHKITCSACKGTKKINAECTKCGGSGKLNSFNGVIACNGCQGRGRYNNIDCPKCKATGKTECKARGCTREVPKPTFESFAEAYKCPQCQGRGSMIRHVALPCGECSGIGIILQPKADPSKLFR